jgi:plasmid stability protein
MKNITLSIPEELVKKGRAYAARHGTTLNALIRQLLKSTVEKKPSSDAQHLVDEIGKLKSPVKSIHWKRDDLYER